MVFALTTAVLLHRHRCAFTPSPLCFHSAIAVLSPRHRCAFTPSPLCFHSAIAVLSLGHRCAFASPSLCFHEMERQQIDRESHALAYHHRKNKGQNLCHHSMTRQRAGNRAESLVRNQCAISLKRHPLFSLCKAVSRPTESPKERVGSPMRLVKTDKKTCKSHKSCLHLRADDHSGGTLREAQLHPFGAVEEEVAPSPSDSHFHKDNGGTDYHQVTTI